MSAQIPRPTRKEHRLNHLGDSRLDPYFWMRDRDSSEVLAHLRAENAYFEEVLGSTKDLQAQIFQELKGRIKEDDSLPPSPLGGFEYYIRFESGKEYPIYCRRPRAGGTEEVLLNVNELAVGLSYCDVGDLKVSPDHNVIAFALDRVGRRLFSICTKDLRTGEISKIELPGTAGDFEWASDSRTLLAIMKHPETLRYEKCVRFDSVNGAQALVYFEPDEIYGLSLSKSLNARSLFLSSVSFDATEVRRIDPQNPSAPPHVFLPRETKHEYSVYDGLNGYYVLTNWEAENFRLMWTESFGAPKNTWREVIAHNPEVFIEGMICFQDYAVLEERFAGLTRLRIMDRRKTSDPGRIVAFPDATYVTTLSINLEYNPSSFRLSYSSPVQPTTWYDCDFGTGALTVVKKTEVPHFDAAKYECARIWAKAGDGTLVPMSVVGKKGFQQSGPRPTLVYGYGSYGLNVEPRFGSNIFSLIDRGFTYAIAHIRGGSDLGRSWYESGRMMNKKNTFTDFIACTEHLVQSGLADRDQLYAMGGSAGGLLMGAVMNLRPDLYRGVVAQVPFVDVVTTMLDASIPLTTAEYEQWGNPNAKEAYDYMKSYSPYDNVIAAKYPHIYIETGYHDSQVQYWEPAKWAARLRDENTGANVVVFRTNMEAGHGGASGRFERLKEIASEYAFILWAMKMPRDR